MNRGIGPTGNGRSTKFNGRRQPSIDGTSRMMREYQVRICERLGAKFPGPTRQSRQFGGVRATSALPLRTDIVRLHPQVRFVPRTEVSIPSAATVASEARHGGVRLAPP